MPKISKVLVANRGEIAVRIMRTCRDLNIKTVAVYSRPDIFSQHVLSADESYFIGEAASSESYLVMDRIIEVARKSGADAIHPGYGFLSENAAFSERCSQEGIIFIGPSPESIRLMGDKTSARKLMEAAGVPLPPGTTTALKSTEEAIRTAEEIGYPVLIKAAAGGGGKGMRIVYDPANIENAIQTARSEAKSAFGDDRVYVEKYLEEPRHIEVQILADSFGNTVHLFDRECSIQRRHQKVVEEAPSAILTDELRDKITSAAVKAAISCNYEGAGTVEFLVDKHRNFYFLEMNTRLQVEHPVTEFITGFDLVEWQIRVASGEKLPFGQNDITCKGHAIECRICAEDPNENFLPSTGLLEMHRIPAGPGVRVDSGVAEGDEVTINYDPLLSKLVVYAETREKAIQRMKRALNEYQIAGVRTTIPFCSFVMDHPDFTSANYDTHFIKNNFTGSENISNSSQNDAILPIAAVILHNTNRDEHITSVATTEISNTYWWSRRLR